MSFPHHQRVTPIAKHVPEFAAGTRSPEADTAPVRSEVRLRVKQSTSARGHVDGAWWPRSHEPEAEFPGLILVMSSWVGPVRRVSYHLDDWHPTAPELTVEGWSVVLACPATVERHTVVVSGTGERSMSLLVVPPDTPAEIAREILRSTAGPDAVGTVEEILARHDLGTAGLHHPRMADPHP